jgi:agmatine deiminase
LGPLAPRLPAEWEPHERCFVAWPGHETYPAELVPYAKPAWIEAVRAIAEFEPVVVVAKPGFGREAASELGKTAEIVELPLDEVWLRDYGPLFVETEDAIAAVDFGFDVWGTRKRPYNQTTALGRYLAEWLGVRRDVGPLVLEGGAVTTDGTGTLIAVQSSVVNENRNPGVGREEIESTLEQFLGTTRVIWLPHGLVEDDGKDGHVDNVVRFVGPGRVVAHTVGDETDPNYSRLAANHAALQRAGLEVVDLDARPYETNFYIGNGCVIVPVAGGRSKAVAVLAEVFPDRAVVGISGENLARCRGGIHCITLEQPRIGRREE